MNTPSAEPPPAPGETLRAGAHWIAAAALLLATLSLGFNLYLVYRLRGAERTAMGAARRVVDRLAETDATLRYSVRLPAGTPIRLDIPLDEQLQVKLNTQLPIDTRVQVPLRTPFGTYRATVPIRTTIPIRQEVPLRIRHTFRLRTQTRDELVVPLEVRVRDLPLDALRESLQP